MEEVLLVPAGGIGDCSGDCGDRERISGRELALMINKIKKAADF